MNLYNDIHISEEQKYEVLGMESSGFLANQYIQKMFLMNHTWYYFRKEEENYGYPFYLMNELLGSYLAKILKLDAVTFQVGCVENKLGLVSKNFRKSNCTYYFGDYFVPYNNLVNANSNVEHIKQFYRNEQDKEIVIDSLLKLLALDIYMLQKDRISTNIQFEENLETKQFRVAPIYDFATCIDSIGLEGIYLNNVIVVLDDFNIRLLNKIYPQFSNYLTILLEQKMSTMFETICEDYHFNQDCFVYEQVKSYYQLKEEKQRQYLKQYIK